MVLHSFANIFKPPSPNNLSTSPGISSSPVAFLVYEIIFKNIHYLQKSEPSLSSECQVITSNSRWHHITVQSDEIKICPNIFISSNHTVIVDYKKGLQFHLIVRV